jgi:uncharacterized membrane protein
VTSGAPVAGAGPSRSGIHGPSEGDLDRTIARLLTRGTYLSIGLMAFGVVLMAATGVSPIDATAPPFDLGRIPADLLALRPSGFLWLGLVVAIATPLARVIASLVGYVRRGERGMALIAAAITAVVAAAVVVGVLAGR